MGAADIEAGLVNLKKVAERGGQKSYSVLNKELAGKTEQPQLDFRNPGDLPGSVAC